MESVRDGLTRVYCVDESGREALLYQTGAEEVDLGAVPVQSNPESGLQPQRGAGERRGRLRVEFGPRVRAVRPARQRSFVVESFGVDDANPHLVACGPYLYSRDGSQLACCLQEVSPLIVAQGVRRIAAHACEGNTRLEAVRFPETLEEIGDWAFHGCVELSEARLPEGVRSVGRAAFLGTSLEELHIPAALEYAGEAAFSLAWRLWQLGDGPQVRLPVSISPDNARFFVQDDFLCEREGDQVRALFYLANSQRIEVPAGVTHIGDYALLGILHARSVALPQSLRTIGEGAFMIGDALENLAIELSDGSVLELYPAVSPGEYTYLGSDGQGVYDVAQLARECDLSMPRANPLQTRSRRMLARLANGVMMDDDVRALLTQSLRASLEDTLRAFARNDDVDGLRLLCDLGLVGRETINWAIGVVNDAGGVRATSLLLDYSRELRRNALRNLEMEP